MSFLSRLFRRRKATPAPPPGSHFRPTAGSEADPVIVVEDPPSPPVAPALRLVQPEEAGQPSPPPLVEPEFEADEDDDLDDPGVGRG